MQQKDKEIQIQDQRNENKIDNNKNKGVFILHNRKESNSNSNKDMNYNSKGKDKLIDYINENHRTDSNKMRKKELHGIDRSMHQSKEEINHWDNQQKKTQRWKPLAPKWIKCNFRCQRKVWL